MRPILRTLSLLVAVMLVAAPLSAYTIYLKDGSRIIAREKYTIEGDTAYIILQNGTHTYIEAKEIDEKRTEEMNQTEYGSAVVIEGGRARALEENERLDAQQPRDQRLSDFIHQQNASLRTRPTTREEKDEGPLADNLPTTLAGWVDFTSIPRQPFAQTEIASELTASLQSSELPKIRVFQGTRSTRPLVELVVGSESAVKEALKASADALLGLRASFGSKVTALEILLVTDAQERAGQFVLTPDQAEDLASQRVELSRFFVENVQF